MRKRVHEEDEQKCKRIIPRHLLFSHQIGGPGWDTDGLFLAPCAVAVGTDGTVFVCDAGNSRVQILDNAGTFLSAIEKIDEARTLSHPVGIALTRTGSIAVVDQQASAVYIFDLKGTLIGEFGSLGVLRLPSAIAVDQEDNFVVVDREGAKIFDSAGTLLRRIDYFVPDANCVVWRATTVCVDRNNMYYFGTNQDFVVATDSHGRNPRAFFLDDVGEGKWLSPRVTGVAVDDSGTLVVLDKANRVFQIMDATRKKWKLLECSDGTNRLAIPCGLAIDASGALYISDWEEGRVIVLTSRLNK